MPHLVFIHGVSNKPEKAELLRIWRRTLGRAENGDDGVNLTREGINSSLIYWADVMYESPDEDVASHESENEAEALRADEAIEHTWSEGEGDGQDWMKLMANKYGFEAEAPDGDDEYVAPAEEADGTFERIPLPWFIKRRFMKAFVRDVHHYLFNKQHSPRPGKTYKVQDEIRSRFVKALEKAAADGPPLVVVAHSQGTVIAYDCLKRVADCPAVDALVTVGSPLGIDEIQDKLHPEWTREKGFPSTKVGGDWVNVYDSIDIVAGLDPKLANDFCKDEVEVIDDINQDNDGLWTHSMTKYLVGKPLRNQIRRLFNIQ